MMKKFWMNLITAIQNESDHMKHLVDQLLFLARGDSGKTQLSLEPVSPNDLMNEIYEESLMIDENHLYRFRPGDPVRQVQADPALLKQAVRILVDNSAKYTLKEPRSFFVPGRLMMESLIWKYRIPGSVCLPKMFPICSSVFTVLTKPAAIREQGLGFLSPGGSLTGIMDVLKSFPVQNLAPGSGSFCPNIT